MRNTLASFIAAAVLASFAGGVSADVLILRGGTKVPIKGAILRQGQNVLVTNADGTLLSVPASEVDFQATAAANKAPSPAPAPAVAAVPERPVEAVRATRGPKARVRITDADVNHQMETPTSEEGSGVAPAAAVGRVELVDHTQQKSGDQLIVKGTLRNPGTATVNGVRLNVMALDDNGKVLSSAPATVAGSSLDPGRTVTFTATLSVGKTLVPILRFSPQWIAPPPPADKAEKGEKESAAPAGAREQAGEEKPAAPAASGAKAPAPQPTPYGRGMLYAAPAASAPTTAPADGKTGYIPGPSSPDNQPKTPQ